MPELTQEHTASRLSASLVGLFLGPVLVLLLLLIGPPATLVESSGQAMPDAWIVLCLLVLMAVWWVTEALPIPVTSLLPMIVLPLAGVMSISEASAPYMHPIIVLLMGGLIFAKAIEQWGLHERIALNFVARTGGNPAGLIGGFMVAAAALSMWISNSATSIMMMPIALSVAAAVETDPDQSRRPFTWALLLGIVYACSIGGLGTPVGTPTNLIVLGYLNDNSEASISFAQWMSFGLPVVAVLVPLTWLILTQWAFRMPKVDTQAAQKTVHARLKDLGGLTSPEIRTLILFAVIASLWVFKSQLNALTLPIGEAGFKPLAGLTDHITAVIAVVLSFLIPAGGKDRQGQRLLTWEAAEAIPWGVLLLFGGGMSLALAISSSGLSTFLGESLAGLASLPLPVLILLITAAVLGFTEVTSNIATASALMPVLGAVALESGLPLEVMAAPVALAASCAFMLPMATAPNAIAYATGKVSLRTMAMAGFRVNLAALFLITAASIYLAPLALGS